MTNEETNAAICEVYGPGKRDWPADCMPVVGYAQAVVFCPGCSRAVALPTSIYHSLVLADLVGALAKEKMFIEADCTDQHAIYWWRNQSTGVRMQGWVYTPLEACLRAMQAVQKEAPRG